MDDFALSAMDKPMDRAEHIRNQPRQLDDSARNQLAGLRHEPCEEHCTVCGACDWRMTGPMSDEKVPMVNGRCPDCIPICAHCGSTADDHDCQTSDE